MFISYEYKYLGFDKKTDEHRYQFKIVDNDFEGGAIVVDGVGPGLRGMVALIDLYEEHKLNVAANLMKAYVWYSKKHHYPIAYIVSWNKKYNPKFAKYEDDLEKYLVLL